MPKSCVYILPSSKRGTLYVDEAQDLSRRLEQHRAGRGSAFTTKYGVTRLVYLEEFDTVAEAMARERKLKRWRRARKIALIEGMNPDWRDMSPRHLW